MLRIDVRKLHNTYLTQNLGSIELTSGSLISFVYALQSQTRCCLNYQILKIINYYTYTQKVFYIFLLN